MHIARPARGHVSAIAHDKRWAIVRKAVPEETARLAEPMLGIARHVAKVRRRSQRARDFALDTAMPRRLTAYLGVGAVILRIPNSTEESHQGVRGLLELPGECCGLSS